MKKSYPVRTVLSFILAVAVVITTVLPGTVPSAAAQEVTPQARQLAVDSALSPLPNLSAAGLAALADGGAGIDEFVATGHEQAWKADLERILAVIVRVTGPTTGQAAKEVMAGGDIDAMAEFIDSGWEAHQLVDDRATVEELAGGDPNDVVTQWANEALAGGDAAITEFISSGQAEAERHDQRRDLYELAASPMPSVAIGAEQALTSNSDRVVEEYLSFGQFAAAAADQEVTDVAALVDRVRQETDAAFEAYEEAAEHGEQAARSAELARQATERSRDYAQAAGEAYNRAEQGARQAGELAQLAGQAADEATAAADEAHAAMIRTAEAMSRAASGAARASQWSAQAQSLAAGAAGDASVAAAARQAAEESERLGKLTRDLGTIAARTAEAQFHANNAGAAAASSAANADAAAAAADQAAAAADDSGAAAEEARAGAAVARAAAARARAASDRVNDLIAQISVKVEEVRQAALEAEEQANLSAEAAYEAIEHAGDAAMAAERAGEAAARAQEAAESAERFAELALEVSELADTAQQARFDREQQLRIDQAIANAQAQQDRDKALAEKEADAQWRETGEELSTLVYDPEVNLQDRADEIEAWAIDLLEHAPEPIRGAAAVALADGSDYAMARLAISGYPFALAQYEQAQAQYWWEKGEGEIAVRAGEVVDSSEEDIHLFLTEELPQLKLPVLRAQVQNLVDGLIAQNEMMVEVDSDPMFDVAIADGQRALESNSTEQLEEFLNTGLLQSMVTDARINAYNSLDIYGPHSKMAAEVAIRDSDQGLIEYQFYTRPAALHADMALRATDAQVEGLHTLNEEMVALAKQAAAEAEAIHARAVEDAARAQDLADQARGFAAQAQEFSDAAKQQVEVAKGHLRKAQEHGARAAAAAGRAEADAATAEVNASVAESHAAAARESSDVAQVAAHEARASAQSASMDAEAAQAAADRMYAHSAQAHHSVRMDVQNAVLEGVLPPEESLWDIIKNELGPMAGDILLDVIGVTDVLDCFGGSVQACLWAAAGAIPIGKIGKLASAAPAIRELIRKADDIYERFKAGRVDREKRATSQVVCSIRTAQAQPSRSGPTQPITFLMTAATNDRCNKPEVKETAQVFQVEASAIKDETDFEILTSWIPSSGRETPMRIVLVEGGDRQIRKMDPPEAKRLQSLVTDARKGDNGDILDKEGAKVEDALLKRIGKARTNFVDSKPINKPKPNGSSSVAVGTDELLLGRGVGEDDMQNLFAQHLANIHSLKSIDKSDNSTDVRVDQGLMSFIEGELHYVGLKRPDVQIHPKFLDGQSDHYEGGVSFEFDRTRGDRDIGHAADFLAANSSGTVVLYTLHSGMFDEALKKNLMKAMEKQREIMGISTSKPTENRP